MKSRVHVIGGGIAGLSTAVALVTDGVNVSVHEAARQAGGRSRSFHDTTLDRTIDNGNHLLLSGNADTMRYAAAIGSMKALTGPPQPTFPFVDVQTDTRWSVTPNRGFVPWWILRSARRVAGTHAWQYLSALRLARAKNITTVEQALGQPSVLYERFWNPFAVGALNTSPEEAAACLLWPVLRETILCGAKHCRPLIAEQGLSHALVDPAVSHLQQLGASVSTGTRLREVCVANGLVTRLRFRQASIDVGETDFVVLALPPWEIADLLPGIIIPDATNPIVNIHFLLPGPVTGFSDTRFIGVVGGLAQWVFLRGDVASVTVSAAHELARESVDRIAERTWQDVAFALRLDTVCPSKYRVIKEKRATIAQTPDQITKRPGTRTHLPNLLLAGSYVNTGLPDTIESAARSGHRAAQHILAAYRLRSS